MLAQRGVPVIDTDDVARAVTAPGTPGHDAVVARFGPRVTAPDGTLDRKALAAVVFDDPAQLADLEAITHPLVHEELERRLGALGDQPFVVIEIPLLDEQRRRRYAVDRVVLVETDAEVAVQRASARGVPAEQVRARQKAQPLPDERRALADRTITNDGSLSRLGGVVDELWPWLSGYQPEARAAEA
jgi:dephospho-CoA kinase